MVLYLIKVGREVVGEWRVIGDSRLLRAVGCTLGTQRARKMAAEREFILYGSRSAGLYGLGFTDLCRSGFLDLMMMG